MKIKEVQAGVKISKNYNSYSMNLVADLDKGESPEKVGEILIEKAKEIVNKNVGDNKTVKIKNKEKEVGAAWYSRDSPGKLSVQYSKGGNFKEIRIEDLEKSGFKQIVNGETFVFRRIPLEKRRNNKMPVFRIYKNGGVE
jgi:uncharacterized protein (DUF736 family)